MAEEATDPREVPWHPRHASRLVGHDEAVRHLQQAFQSGSMHHAWLLTGEAGIGKATLAYAFCKWVLNGGKGPFPVEETSQAAKWIAARSAPDLFVLERQVADRKPFRLKTEISVDDARHLSHFFSRTSGSGGWRIGLVDAADDLNTESANALLKLIEEPPSNCLILLVSHRPGRLLPTLKSRCARLSLKPLEKTQTIGVLRSLPLDPGSATQNLETMAALSRGSPGQALTLLKSEGAKVFEAFDGTRKAVSALGRLQLIQNFTSRGPNSDDYAVFVGLLLDWLAGQAKVQPQAAARSQMAEAYARIAEASRVTEGFNLDRRQSLLEQLRFVEEALKPA